MSEVEEEEEVVAVMSSSARTQCCDHVCCSGQSLVRIPLLTASKMYLCFYCEHEDKDREEMRKHFESKHGVKES
jgi:hypothetical protein